MEAGSKARQADGGRQTDRPIERRPECLNGHKSGHCRDYYMRLICWLYLRVRLRLITVRGGEVKVCHCLYLCPCLCLPVCLSACLSPSLSVTPSFLLSFFPPFPPHPSPPLSLTHTHHLGLSAAAGEIKVCLVPLGLHTHTHTGEGWKGERWKREAVGKIGERRG